MGVTSCGRRPHEATVLYVFNWIAPRSSTVPFGVPIEPLVYNSGCGRQRRLDRLESAGVVHVGDQGLTPVVVVRRVGVAPAQGVDEVSLERRFDHVCGGVDAVDDGGQHLFGDPV